MEKLAHFETFKLRFPGFGAGILGTQEVFMVLREERSLNPGKERQGRSKLTSAGDDGSKGAIYTCLQFLKIFEWK